MTYILALTLFLLPTYTIKYNIFGFHTNILMLWIFFLWFYTLVWLIKFGLLKDFFKSFLHEKKSVLVLIGLFFICSVISLIVGKINEVKIGYWLVLFLQPLSLYFIFKFVATKKESFLEFFLKSIYLFIGITGVYAVYQFITLHGLPSVWWGNKLEPKRAISVFIHPNFYALFITPLLGFLLPDLVRKIKNKLINFWVILWMFGIIGLLLSMSRAGWLGLTTGFIIYGLKVSEKKIRLVLFSIFAIVAITIFITPNLRWRLLGPFYGEKSANSRIQLWSMGANTIKQSPIFGLGLTGFSNNWPVLNKDHKLPDSHNFPHNIFLNFWLETGILGLISFFGLVFILIKNGFIEKIKPYSLNISLFLIILIVQGLIDNPYFKNDLAVLFWLILGFV